MKSFNQFIKEQMAGGPPGGFPDDLPDFPEEGLRGGAINDDGTWTFGGYTWKLDKDGNLMVLIDGVWYLRGGALDADPEEQLPDLNPPDAWDEIIPDIPFYDLDDDLADTIYDILDKYNKKQKELYPDRYGYGDGRPDSFGRQFYPDSRSQPWVKPDAPPGGGPK